MHLRRLLRWQACNSNPTSGAYLAAGVCCTLYSVFVYCRWEVHIWCFHVGSMKRLQITGTDNYTCVCWLWHGEAHLRHQEPPMCSCTALVACRVVSMGARTYAVQLCAVWVRAPRKSMAKAEIAEGLGRHDAKACLTEEGRAAGCGNLRLPSIVMRAQHLSTNGTFWRGTLPRHMVAL